jgi:hypothetical protein
MSPIEKANALIEKFKSIVQGNIQLYPGTQLTGVEYTAKECALLLVGEINESFPPQTMQTETSTFWMEVKAELEKI